MEVAGFRMFFSKVTCNFHEMQEYSKFTPLGGLLPLKYPGGGERLRGGHDFDL